MAETDLGKEPMSNLRRKKTLGEPSTLRYASGPAPSFPVKLNLMVNMT